MSDTPLKKQLEDRTRERDVAKRALKLAFERQRELLAANYKAICGLKIARDFIMHCLDDESMSNESEEMLTRLNMLIDDIKESDEKKA